MTPIRSFLRSSFGSALLGGAFAVALGAVAISTGLISVDNSSGSTVAASPIAPRTEPAAGSGRTVGQVYQDDAQGVAFIEAEQKSTAATTPFGGPPAAAPQPAPGSSSTVTATSSPTLTSSTARAR